MVADHKDLIGRKAKLTFDKLTFTVIIKDIRQSWGNLHALVTPASLGMGEQWVDLQRLYVLPDEN